MKYILSILAIVILCIPAKAQFVGEMDWESEEDYKSVESLIVRNILWLEENPFATETNDTKAISNYVLKWISETPYVSVRLDEVFTVGITDKKNYKYSDKFLVTYLFGKSLHAINNPDQDDEIPATVRGIEGMVKVYNEILKVDGKGKNSTLDYYRQLQQSARLEEYVKTRLSESGI